MMRSDDTTERAAGKAALFSHLWPWLLLLFPLGLAVSTLGLLRDAHSPAPFMDQWENLLWWRRALTEGHVPFDYWFSQHNEHRPALARLVYLADLKWFAGSNALDLAVILLIQLAGAALFGWIAVTSRPRPLGIAALALATAILASAAQWENFFWGFQVAFVGVYAAGAGAIYLFCRATTEGAVRWGLLAGAVVLLAAAVGCMANGVFAGAAMVAVAVLGRRGWPGALAAGLATAVLLALYLHGYVRSPTPPHPPLSLTAYGAYGLAYLGAVWGFGRPLLAITAGAAGLVSTLGMAVLLIRGRVSDPGRAALVGVVVFVGLSAALTTVARAGLGLEQALSSRYVTPGAYFWAAQALFWGLTLQGMRNRTLLAFAAIPLLAAAVLLLRIQQRSADQLFAIHDHILMGASAVKGGVVDAAAYRRLYPQPEKIIDLAPFLRAQRLSLFADDLDLQAGDAVPTARVRPPGACLGTIDAIRPDWEGGLNWSVLGWGWDVGGHRPPGAVVIATADGLVLGVALPGLRRKDVKRAVAEVDDPRAGWTGLARPAPGVAIRAYGLLADGGLCLLGERRGPV